jgi:predicted O-methyltransferase YrrM
MKSSYLTNAEFGDILSSIVFTNNPKKIVEFGIFEGYSLLKFAENSNSNTDIEAYDIFEDFNGNHGDIDKLQTMFKAYKNVRINYGNFYEVVTKLADNSVDILHIDIANNGDVYEYVFQHCICKLSSNGIIILEGGSEKRDNVEWMQKYNKPKIQPVIKKYSDTYNIMVIGSFPSLTIIRPN